MIQTADNPTRPAAQKRSVLSYPSEIELERRTESAVPAAGPPDSISLSVIGPAHGSCTMSGRSSYVKTGVDGFCLIAVEPYQGHEISVVLPLAPAGTAPEHAEPGLAPGRVKGEMRGPPGPADCCLGSRDRRQNMRKIRWLLAALGVALVSVVPEPVS